MRENVPESWEVGMPIPTILAGSWLGAEPDFMDEHEQKLCLGTFHGSCVVGI